ncbi:MAG: PD-(D/E)XK nuclease family protein [Methylocella sp.]
MDEQLEPFFRVLDSITRIAAVAQRQLDFELATGFSATKLLRPDERQLSDTFACLLDPAEAHGQGGLFLGQFIEMFGISGVPTDRALCHVAREKGRIDILVEIGSIAPFAIGIENKPWAGDRANQVRCYCHHLAKYFPERWWFGYLSGTGSHPPDHSIEPQMRMGLEAKGRFRTIPFARLGDNSEVSIEDWLMRCAEVCRAERVRWFLRDLLDYVASNFSEEATGHD